LRDHYDEITRRGGEIVAIGTGNVGYAKAFVDEENIPFPVLVDDAGYAAKAASIPSLNFFKLVLNPNSRKAMRRARDDGHRIHKAGRRVTQLGATFVIGPGDAVRYEHLDVDSSDHAPPAEVVAAIPEPAAN
jgi:AhpC/TSA antioxidant enzyme